MKQIIIEFAFVFFTFALFLAIITLGAILQG